MTGRGKQTKTRDILHATVDHSELKCVVADVEQDIAAVKRRASEGEAEMEGMAMKSKNWVNIFLLGMGFMLLFTAFQTSAFVQSVTIDSFLSPKCVSNGTRDTINDGGITISEAFSKRIGLISLIIIYLMVAVVNWISVPVVAVFGSKWSCVVAGAFYVAYLVALTRPYVPVIFFSAFVLGSAGGILWTAQGQILIQNSSKVMMGVTSGIFWLMLQSSLIVGNLFFFLYLEFRVKKNPCIAREDNYIIFAIFTLLGVAGIFFLALIQPTRKLAITKPNINADSDSETKPMLTHGTKEYDSRGKIEKAFKDALISLRMAMKIFLSVDMLLLSVCFIYTGLELNFWSGVYGTIIGRTHLFPKAYIGLAGLFIGLGEIVGGGLFGILGKYANRYGKDPIVLLGMLVHFATFLLIYYNLPNDAVQDDVDPDKSFGTLLTSNAYITMTCAFLLGFGDACFNTQVYAMIGTLYPSDAQSAPAMALFKFFQSIAAMAGFLISTVVRLQWQLLILVVMGALGTLSFAMVEWKHYKPPSSSYQKDRKK